MMKLVASLLVGTALVTAPSQLRDPRGEQNVHHWIYYRPQSILQPLIMDSSLLFFSPDLVWRCDMKEKYVDVEWYEADFKDVASCECTREMYTLVPSSSHRRYYQKLLSQELRARLIRDSGTSFLYTEYDPADSSVLRSFQMNFDTSAVVTTDTIVTEDLMTGEIIKTEFTKLVKLERAR